MISFTLILKIIVIVMALEGWNQHLHRERKAKYYLGDRIEYKADSLLDSWAENEMKRDSL